MKKIVSIILCLLLFIGAVFSEDVKLNITKSYSKYQWCKPPIIVPQEKTLEENRFESIHYFGDESLAIPYCESPEKIVHHTGYSLFYSENDEQALWVAYLLTAEEVSGNIARSDNFRADLSILTSSASLYDYKGSGYDRGHLIPAADLKWSTMSMSDSFYLSNMSPQEPGFNRGVWKRLEEWVREQALNNFAVYVVTSPVLTDGPYETIGENRVSIPKHYYKVILDYTEPEFKAIGFIIPNKSSKADLSTFAVTIDEVEKITGLDFFYLLPDNIEEILESEMNYYNW